MATKSPSEETDMISPLFSATGILEALGNRYIFNPVGLTSTSFKILTALKQTPTTPSTLLVSVDCLKSNLSQRLRALENKGLIRRLPNKNDNDKRRVFFQLTENGKKILQQAEAHAKHASLSFEKRFTKKELEQHHAFFAKLTRLLAEKETVLEKHFHTYHHDTFSRR